MASRPRLKTIALLFVIIAVVRIVEFLPHITYVLARWSDPIHQAMAIYEGALAAFDLAVIAILVALAIGLYLGHEGTYRFLVANIRVPLVLFSLIVLCSFVVGAILSPLLLLVILALLLSRQTREEVEGVGYAAPSHEAMRTLAARRGFHEAPPPTTEGEVLFAARRSTAKLCPECDALNDAEATTCRQCGATLAK